jgi:hypothetical protein
MWHWVFRWRTITGRSLTADIEGGCTEKWIEKFWQERYFQNAWYRVIQAGFGGVL